MRPVRSSPWGYLSVCIMLLCTRMIQIQLKISGNCWLLLIVNGDMNICWKIQWAGNCCACLVKAVCSVLEGDRIVVVRRPFTLPKTICLGTSKAGEWKGRKRQQRPEKWGDFTVGRWASFLLSWLMSPWMVTLRITKNGIVLPKQMGGSSFLCLWNARQISCWRSSPF